MLLIAKEFNIQQPKEWGKVTVRDVYERGGRHLLQKYDGSLAKALQNIFTGKFSK